MVKIGVSLIPPFGFLFLRMIVSFMIMSPLFLKSKLSWQKFKPLILISFLPTINIVFFALGVSLTGATIGQALYAACPLLAGVLAYWVLGSKLSRSKIIGVVLGMFGVVVMILLPVWQKTSFFSGGLSGNLLIMVGVLAYSFYQVVSQKAQEEYPPIIITLAFISVALVVIFPLALVELSREPGWWRQLNLQVWLSVLYAGSFGTAVAYGLNQYIIKFGGPVLAAMTLYLQPVFAFLWARVLLGERLTPGLVFGGSLALVGVWLVTKSADKAKEAR